MDVEAGPEVARLADCPSAEAGLEFFQPAIANFEGGTAQYMYTYFDGTSAASPSGYQPAAVSAPRCASDPTNASNNQVFHIQGGPFLGWGGGLGIAMEHLSQDLRLCVGVSPLPDFCPPASAGTAVSFAALDLSQWDGVAVWARRGRNSQALLRVLVGNKDTDDDISYLDYLDNPKAPRNCERVRECACTYQNHPCGFVDAGTSAAAPSGGYYCGAPGAAPGQAIMAPQSSTGTATNTCDVTRCNDPFASYPMNGPDLQFTGRPCAPFTYRSGTESSFCYDPATDPPPAQTDQQCGDHWTFPLSLTTDWQLYKVPFSTMYQQGFAKRFPTFDLKSISVVRLTWDAGLVDYWVDDLRFYRTRR